jgi:transcription initiation factor TFIID TATA-box-binding protein
MNNIELNIQNVVSLIKCDVKFNLRQIVLHSRNSEYNPKKFPAIIMRIKEPKTTALIFSTGKIICSGAKSIQHSKIAARKYLRIMQKLGYNVKFNDFTIQNIICKYNFNNSINLEQFQINNSNYTTYEPELFPGLIYRIIIPKITVLIFTSGKIIFTGGKNISDIENVFFHINELIKNI